MMVMMMKMEALKGMMRSFLFSLQCSRNHVGPPSTGESQSHYLVDDIMDQFDSIIDLMMMPCNPW